MACALPETAQGCGSVRSALLQSCRWPAVHVVRWGFVGGSFQRTARAINFYNFRPSVQLLAPCTRRRRVHAVLTFFCQYGEYYSKYATPRASFRSSDPFISAGLENISRRFINSTNLVWDLILVCIDAPHDWL